MRPAEESHQPVVRRHLAQSTVEVALSLPVLMLVFVMLLQGALYMHALNVVRSAAQEGARAATAEGATLADGAARTRTMLAAGLGRSSDSLAIGVDEDARGGAARRHWVDEPASGGADQQITARATPGRAGTRNPRSVPAGLKHASP